VSQLDRELEILDQQFEDGDISLGAYEGAYREMQIAYDEASEEERERW